MSHTPNSIEVQIDNFLEQFKRSASKAMDGDWVTSQTSSSSRPTSGSSATILTHGEHLANTFLGSKKRNSCMDISELSLSGMRKLHWIVLFFFFVVFFCCLFVVGCAPSCWGVVFFIVVLSFSRDSEREGVGAYGGANKFNDSVETPCRRWCHHRYCERMSDRDLRNTIHLCRRAMWLFVLFFLSREGRNNLACNGYGVT